MRIRTDLAVEAREEAGEGISGVSFESYKENGLEISRLTVETARAGRILGKPKGTYVTVELPSLTDNFSDTDDRLKTIGKEISRLLPVNGLMLVAGLGNYEITPDSLGPKTGAKVIATRHITGELARASGLDRLRPVAVICPGVTGQTGIETEEMIFSIARNIKPTAVVVVDALASRRIERLGTTLQISNAGISPGAGVGNRRVKINEETVGVPVISIGVPTVVDLPTLAGDILGREPDEETAKSLLPNGRKMVVIPGEIDLLCERASRLIALSLNFAMQNGLELEDIVNLM